MQYKGSGGFHGFSFQFFSKFWSLPDLKGMRLKSRDVLIAAKQTGALLVPFQS